MILGNVAGTVAAIALTLIPAATVISGQMPPWDRKRHDIKRNIELGKQLTEVPGTEDARRVH